METTVAFTSRNDEVLLIQAGKVIGVATVAEAKVMLNQLRAAIASSSIERPKSVEGKEGE